MTLIQYPRANPFSTRFVKPGAIPYIFADGESESALIARLAALDWRAQIIGPHGSGKSTLVAHLLATLTRAGREPFLIKLRDGQRRVPAAFFVAASEHTAHKEQHTDDTPAAPPECGHTTLAWAPTRLVVIDGYEQLSFFSKWRVKRICRRRAWGLLITTHRDAGFLTLIRTSASLAMAEAVVGRLLPQNARLIERRDIAECFAASRHNLRETLFALYDRYESLRTRGD